MKLMGRSVVQFEATHGAPKLKRMEHELAVEREKVAALAGAKDRVTVVPVSDRNTISWK